MTRRFWIAPLAITVGLLTAGCSQVDDLVDDATGGDSLPTEAAAEQTRLEIELLRDGDDGFREAVFCSPKDASRSLAGVASEVLGAPDPATDLEDFAGAGQGELAGNVLVWCEWDHQGAVAGVDGFGVSSGPIQGSIEDYVTDILSVDGDTPQLEVEQLDGAHGGDVHWICLAEPDETGTDCEINWNDGTFVVSLYFFGSDVSGVDPGALRDGFVAEIPAFVEAAATVLE